jgi:NADH-quinone oxidoreductase subunit C
MIERARRLAEAFPGAAVTEEAGDTRVHVSRAEVKDVLRWLREHGFDMLTDLTAADHWPNREPRFDVVYILFDTSTYERLMVKVAVGDGESLPTVSDIWRLANWAEREVMDLFGIPFEGHPDPRRILMPDDWDGHPLRRDYPLIGTEPPPPLARE